MKLAACALVLTCLPFLSGCGSEAATRPDLAYVTNGTDPFWTIAAAGARAAAADFDVDCEILMPAEGVVDQKRMVESCLTRGVDGIAISPIDAANQAEMIDSACAQTNVITHDSDAPTTQRLCFVGPDNYNAGRLAGKLVREALPDGGSVVLFVGRLEQDNARKRRQGLIDELLERSHNPTRYDPPGKELKSDKYTVLDTRTDQFARDRAKANAEDAIALYSDLGCMVGLFAYNTPACLEALRDADKLGKIKVVAFDEHEATLQGVQDGHVHATVVQDPYRYGFDSIRILAALARGDRNVLPKDKILEIPTNPLRKKDVIGFQIRMKSLLGKKK